MVKGLFAIGRLLIGSAVALGTIPGASGNPSDADRPNIILVMPDDQGYGDLGAHGHPVLQTPNLDRLHDRSVRLTNFHVDPTCSPTRAALFTGRYSTRTGVWHTIAGRSLMDPDEVTMAELLAEAGYRTGIFGKWHLGDNAPLRARDQGFQHALVHGGGGVTQTPDYWGNDYFDDTYYQNGRPVTFRGYCTDIWFDNALAFIERNRDRPFFCYLPLNAAHGPFRAPEEYVAMYEQEGIEGARAAFYGMITHIDDNMGRLMENLEALEIADETILIFMTDNGTARGAFNAGLRGTKGSHYEGGHRVPFFIRYPDGGIQGGRAIDRLTAHIDLLPTLAHLTGISMPERLEIDGSNLTPLLTGEGDQFPNRTVFVHSQRIQHPEKWRRAAVMTDRWRLVDQNELYDMNGDRGQERNVAERHPDAVKRLQSAYDRWWDSLEPVFEDDVRIVIGSAAENPARLTAHDWHPTEGGVPWNQQQIRNMPEANGWWAIRVSRSGGYRFTLRHHPSQAAKELEAEKARLKIGDQVDQTKPVPDGSTEVSFRVDLEAGPERLQTWLDAPDASRGAFFIDVKYESD